MSENKVLKIKIHFTEIAETGSYRRLRVMLEFKANWELNKEEILSKKSKTKHITIYNFIPVEICDKYYIVFDISGVIRSVSDHLNIKQALREDCEQCIGRFVDGKLVMGTGLEIKFSKEERNKYIDQFMMELSNYRESVTTGNKRTFSYENIHSGRSQVA